jgi:hypothetical protein
LRVLWEHDCVLNHITKVVYQQPFLLGCQE